MNIDSPDSMDSKTWHWVQSRLTEFDQNWIHNVRPDFCAFARNTEFFGTSCIGSEDLRGYCLTELIKIDLKHRWRAGEPGIADDYIAQFPQLAGAYHDQLVEAEFEVRHAVGQPPKLDELKNRFPLQVEKWQRLLDSIDSSTYLPDALDTLPGDDTIKSSAAPNSKGQLQAGDRLGKYLLKKELGRGSFAVVWLADDSQLNRQVALKLILPSKLHLDRTLVPRLMREARAVALVDHPGVVQVHEVGQENGMTFISEQYVDGPPLSRLIRDTAIDTTSAVEIVRDVALAAHAAHECGIVHRDIKPGNILLGSDHKPRLVDFGLAAFEAHNEITLTRQGDMLGTPAYMSPQQALAQNHLVDCRTDVYSLGAVLYHLIVGRVPFPGTTLSVLNAVVNQQATSLFKSGNGVPKDLETIILRCLEKEPSSRYESAAQLAADLERFREGRPILARPVGTLERVGKWIRRKPRVAALLAIGLVLATILLVSLWQLRNVSQQRNTADRLKQAAQTEMIQKTIVAGQLAMERGRMQEATQHLKLAFAQESDLVIAPVVGLDLVECLLATREISAAQAAFKSTHSGSLPEQLTGRSKVLQAQLLMEQQPSLPDAEQLLADALALPLSSALEHYVRAMLSVSTRAAIAELQQSLSADPLHHQSHRMLCLLSFSLAEFEQAEQRLQEAISLFPDDEDFRLLHCALLAATGREQLAQNQLAQMDLPEAEQATWGKICNRFKCICTEYSHHYSDTGAGDFTLAAMAEIAEDYLGEIHPEFVKRGFHFPPAIAEKFSALVRDLERFFALELKENDLAPTIEDLVAVHPEASLCCWLGGKQIGSGEIEKAKTSFFCATRNSGFISDTLLMSWKGLFATSVALWQRNVEPIQQYQDAVDSIEQIESIPGGVAGFMETPHHVRTITIFLIEAMRTGVADEDLVLRWLARAKECQAMNEAWIAWSHAVIANISGRKLDAVKFLSQVEKLDPGHKSVPASQVQGMKKSVRDQIVELENF